MDAIARHFGENSLTVNRAVKNMNAGNESDVAMQDLVPIFCSSAIEKYVEFVYEGARPG